jgi:hypothetical protein
MKRKRPRLAMAGGVLRYGCDRCGSNTGEFELAEIVITDNNNGADVSHIQYCHFFAADSSFRGNLDRAFRTE